MRLKNDLLDLILATLNNNLSIHKISWIEEPGITIVAASKGYPGEFEKLVEIKNLNQFKNNEKEQLFHASTIKNAEEKIFSNGGRVLSSTVISSNLKDARDKALSILDNLEWKNKYYRRDIGYHIIK